MTRLRIYLAGPIRGCNEEQRTWWRSEVKQLLKKDFDFEDPTEWADDFVVSREIAKLEACDILLANMWKESIGTTLGVVRARHQGKPVMLSCSQHRRRLQAPARTGRRVQPPFHGSQEGWLRAGLFRQEGGPVGDTRRRGCRGG